MNIQTQNARNSDPSTSHLAGEVITKSGSRQIQINLVADLVNRQEGLTSAEIAARYGVDRYMVARRLPDSIEVKKGASRKCSISGRLAVTWWVK